VLSGARSTLDACSESYETFRLDALQQPYDAVSLPYALKVLLENLIRNDCILRQLIKRSLLARHPISWSAAQKMTGQ